MIAIPALLLTTAPGFGADDEPAPGAPANPIHGVTANAVAEVERATAVRGSVAAIPAAAPAVPVPMPEPPPPPPKPRYVGAETGGATWYQTFDGTCAHVTLPMGTMVTVTRLDTGAVTTCRVADRGPFGEGRVVDLDLELFAELADPQAGILPVKLEW